MAGASSVGNCMRSELIWSCSVVNVLRIYTIRLYVSRVGTATRWPSHAGSLVPHLTAHCVGTSGGVLVSVLFVFHVALVWVSDTWKPCD
jgi:hypothetical protein